ncbi:CPS_collapsed_G0005980.mRNA.1.CDS.1 [Saccharomyces cerevisiae]|nr:CPS_collapsed_G0005980.mRNA.1.CDS.1 [Saccharomyces cerevisiae]
MIIREKSDCGVLRENYVKKKILGCLELFGLGYLVKLLSTTSNPSSKTIIKETPTAFNSQPNRAVILTGETHKKVWDEVTKAIESPAGQKEACFSKG